MTVKQAAKSLNKTERTIMRWIYTEYIKAHKIGGMWEIADEEVKRIKTGERRNDDA